MYWNDHLVFTILRLIFNTAIMRAIEKSLKSFEKYTTTKKVEKHCSVNDLFLQVPAILTKRTRCTFKEQNPMVR